MHRLWLIALLALFAGLAWWLQQPADPGNAPVTPERPMEAPTTIAMATPTDGLVREQLAHDTPGPTTAAAGPEPTAELRILVVDEGGVPVPGCAVRATAKTTLLATATTDTEGRTSLVLPHGRHRLDVIPTDERLAPIDGRVTIEPDVPELRILLERSTRLAFHVLLRIGDPPRPFAFARATLLRHGGGHGELTSDPDGYLAVIAGGPRDTLAIAPGTGNGPCFVVPTAGHETRASALPVTVPAAAALTVTVVDASDRPLADRVVALAVDSQGVTWPAGAFTRTGIPAATGRTDGLGVVEFAPLAAGAVGTTRLVDDALASPPVVERRLVGGANNVTMRLDAGAIRGSVRDDAGRALADVQVGVEFASSPKPPLVMPPVPAGPRLARTDAAGRFGFTHLPPGIWRVGIVPTREPDPPPEPVCRVVETLPGVVAEVELRARPGGFLDATTMLADGSPVGGVSVDVYTADGDEDYVTGGRSDASGHVRLGPLPRGEWRLVTDVFDGRLGVPAPVPARTGDRDVRLVLQPTMVDVRIAVVDEVGRPRRATLWLRHRTIGDALGIGSGLDGRAEHAGLRAGTWDLLADDDCGNVGWLESVELAPGDRPTSLRVDLRPGGAVVVPCPPTEGLELWCSRGPRIGFQDMVLPNEVRRVTLPAGEWTIELRRGREVVARQNAHVEVGGAYVVRW